MNSNVIDDFNVHQVTIETTPLFGIDVHRGTMQTALIEIENAIHTRHSLGIGMLNAAKVVNMRKNQELHDSVVSSDLIMADGASIVAASRLFAKPLPERVAGIDLMYAILEQGNAKGYRIYCLGASHEISQIIQSQISIRYPNVIIAGAHHGYYSESEEKSVVLDIASSNADVLFVAMTSPKKERFMAKYNQLMKVPVVHGVGGSFDVLAGKVQRAPLLWQKYGFEWLYRLKQEPRRLFYRYLITNCTFVYLLIKEIVSPTPTAKSTALEHHG